MEKHYFFYGTQVYEFERPKVSELIAKHGLFGEVTPSIYKLLIIQGGDNVFVIKQNDTLPNLECKLLDSEDTPLDLELCNVKFHMTDRKNNVLISRNVDIVNSEGGDIRVTWLEGDTSISGTFKGEFEVNMPDGKIITVPNDKYFSISIVPQLD